MKDGVQKTDRKKKMSSESRVLFKNKTSLSVCTASCRLFIGSLSYLHGTIIAGTVSLFLWCQLSLALSMLRMWGRTKPMHVINDREGCVVGPSIILIIYSQISHKANGKYKKKQTFFAPILTIHISETTHSRRSPVHDLSHCREKGWNCCSTVASYESENILRTWT